MVTFARKHSLSVLHRSRRILRRYRSIGAHSPRVMCPKERSLGVGSWFHGSANFQGDVNNSFDPQHGYNGRMPNKGEKATTRTRAPKQFKGNEVRDGRGHTS